MGFITWISLPTKVSTMETKTWPSRAVICRARLQLTGASGAVAPVKGAAPPAAATATATAAAAAAAAAAAVAVAGAVAGAVVGAGGGVMELASWSTSSGLTKMTIWTSWAHVALNDVMSSSLLLRLISLVSLGADELCSASSASRMNWMTCARNTGIMDDSFDSSYTSMNLETDEQKETCSNERVSWQRGKRRSIKQLAPTARDGDAGVSPRL